VDNLPKTNLPDQGLPPIPAAQDAAAVLASPPSSSLAAAAAGALPAVTKPATSTTAAGPKAGAAPAGSPKTPLSAQKALLHQQQLQTIVKNPAAKNSSATASTTASLPVASAPAKAVTPTPAAVATAKAAPQTSSIGTTSKAPSTTATTTAQATLALDPKAPISQLYKTYFDIPIPLSP